MSEEMPHKRRGETLLAHYLAGVLDGEPVNVVVGHTAEKGELPLLIVATVADRPADGFPDSAGQRELEMSIALVTSAHDHGREVADGWLDCIEDALRNVAAAKVAMNAPATGTDTRPAAAFTLTDIILGEFGTDIGSTEGTWSDQLACTMRCHGDD